jgi:ParB family chromosome partitioning protein
MGMPNWTIQSAQLQSVSLTWINLEDDTFRITTRRDVNDLIASIQHEGLIAPPLLVMRSSTFSIISGFRRITACRQMGWNDIDARILDPALSPLGCLRYAIADNALQRPLNLIEKSRCLQKLSSFLVSSEQLAESAFQLGLPANPSIIAKLRTLCLLPEPIQHSILADTISLSMAIELGSMDSASGTAFVQLYDQLKLSLNKQREIVMLVREIARRDNMTVTGVLADSKLKDILHHEELDRSQKSQKIRYYLRQRRFPSIYAMEQKRGTHLKQLKLGNHMRLEPPKEFEGTTFTLSLHFKNLSDFQALQNRLEKLGQNPSFINIVEGKDAFSDLS